MPGRLHHIPFFVLDMDRALHLFQDVFEFNLLWHIPSTEEPLLATVLNIPEVVVEMAYLEGDENQVAIELIRLLPPGTSTPATINNGRAGTLGLSILVNNIESLYDRLSTEGWQPYTQILPVRPPAGGRARMFCFRTEEDVTIEVVEIK